MEKTLGTTELYIANLVQICIKFCVLFCRMREIIGN